LYAYKIIFLPPAPEKMQLIENTRRHLYRNELDFVRPVDVNAPVWLGAISI
jgi:hypothetical protein